MSNDPMLLPQTGYVFPSPFPTFNPTALASFPVLSPPNVITSPVFAPSNADYTARYARLSSPVSLSSASLSNNDKDFRIVSWEELKKLLPEVPEGRLESGLLADGRAFAQKTAKKDNFFLFPSKSAYIIYFTHYYFSRENLDRDQTMRTMMADHAAVPIDKIIEAPRLASIGTTVDDMRKAIETSSNVLCLVDLPDGQCLVKRIDGYPGNPVSTSVSLPLDAAMRSAIDSSVGSYGYTEVPSPVASADPLIKDELSAVPEGIATSSYNIQYQNPVDAGLYQQPPTFIRPAARPPLNPSPSSIAVAMAAMNLGPPPPTAHPSATPQNLFGQLQPPNQLAAAINAAFHHRVITHQLQYAAAQGRGASTAHPNQQQMYQHRRTTPSPQASTNLYQFPSQPFYSFHPHENVSHQFPTTAYHPHQYDQWGADATNAVMAAATGFQLQYAPPPQSPSMLFWPQASLQLKTPPQPSVSQGITQPISTISDTVIGGVSGNGGNIVDLSGNDVPSVVVVTDASGDYTTQKMTLSSQSRPNSGCSVKAKFIPPKCVEGHNARPLHSIQSPPISTSTKDSTSVNASVPTLE